MSDLVDRANDRADELREEALQKQLGKSHLADAGDWQRLSAPFCECGLMIPDARRRAIPGVRNCVHCQQDLERRMRRGRS